MNQKKLRMYIDTICSLDKKYSCMLTVKSLLVCHPKEWFDVKEMAGHLESAGLPFGQPTIRRALKKLMDRNDVNLHYYTLKGTVRQISEYSINLDKDSIKKLVAFVETL